MSDIYTKVLNRGIPPKPFIDTLIAWGQTAPDDIFAENDNPRDIYATIKAALGPWEGPLHRKAVMLEVMRVHAGFESSWNWNEGVDTSNHHSVAHIEGQETGAWQVSFDSTYLWQGMAAFARARGIETPQKFIPAIKQDHQLAMEYYTRLIRVNVQWAGPIKRHEIDLWLKRGAVLEFERLRNDR